MNNFLNIILIFIIITSCSLHKNSKFWTNEKIVEEKKENNIKIFEEEKALAKELNSNLKISLYTKAINRSFINNFDNNNGRINFSGEPKNKSKFKFSKIKDFYDYDPKLSFYNNDIIFFDNKGTILFFDGDQKKSGNRIFIIKQKKN